LQSGSRGKRETIIIKEKAMTKARLVGIFLFLAGATIASATSYVAMADEDLTDQAMAVARVKVVGVDPGPASGAPATDYLVEVERVDKGYLPASTVTVRVPGGVRADGLGLKIFGAPEFQVGDEPLLFLTAAPDGSFRILHLMLGAFHTLHSGSAVVAFQDLSGAHRVGGTGRAEPVGVRDLERFENWVGDLALGRRRAPDYWREVPDGIGEKFAQIKGPDGLPVRWFKFDNGGSVAWKVDAAGQPGVGQAISVQHFQAAMQAWNADPTSTINYTYAGLIAAGSGSGLRGTDGVNAILFNDPGNANVPGTYDCKAGGVLAMGGPYFDSTSTRSYRGQPYHETVEADIVFQDGTDCFFANNPSGLEEVMAHELGHTLGFAHSTDPDALMWAYAHNDGRGARLSDDERVGASQMYGDGSFQAPPPPPPPATANLKLTAKVSRTQVRLLWANAPQGTAELRIESQDGSGSFVLLKAVAGATKQAMVTGLRPNQPYVMRVEAMAADGSAMGLSNVIQFRTRR
jgi:Matrixin